ncbi:MAG: WG repeat-containing protein [Microcystis sp. M090S1]|uniref:WG repeat-containing protein n=1 Tax=Microcystis sp. M090S1 TaxID=2771135 RepID=UPI002586AC89|nr:WG repeat-containing protein [Microcystis sp. M090S1]MCA2814269.1 WG repeat-containing protein [Microcystis sp. M090S1]
MPMLSQSEKQQSIKLARIGVVIGLLIPFMSIFSSIIFALTSYLVIAPKFDEASYFQEGLAKVRIGDKYGYIDKTGKTVIPIQFDSIDVYEFQEGLAKVKIGGKWGYIDRTGKIVIGLQFNEVGDFSEGLAKVEIGGKWGYIDRTGEIVIPPTFEDSYYHIVGDFHKGLAKVKIDGEWGYIDKTGKMVLNLEFDKDESEPKSKEAKSLQEGLEPVRMGYKYGYIRTPLK